MSILYLLPESGRDLAAEVMKDSPLPGRHVTPDAFQHEPLADVTGIILSTSHYTAALRDRLQGLCFVKPSAVWPCLNFAGSMGSAGRASPNGARSIAAWMRG